MKKGIIKTKITADYILDLYEKARKIKNKKSKVEAFKNIKKLSENMGKYLVRPV